MTLQRCGITAADGTERAKDGSLLDEIAVLVDRELYVDVMNLLSTDSQLVIESSTFQPEQTQWNAHW